MPPRDWELRIEDILHALDKIQKFTTSMDFDTFQADEKTVDAVVRNLEIIGEAASHVPTEVQTRFPQVPWPQMRGLRNEVAHAYFRVDTAVVWDAIQRNLPPLVPLLREILEREP